jgi:hypothetical protein
MGIFAIRVKARDSDTAKGKVGCVQHQLMNYRSRLPHIIFGILPTVVFAMNLSIHRRLLVPFRAHSKSHCQQFIPGFFLLDLATNTLAAAP